MAVASRRLTRRLTFDTLRFVKSSPAKGDKMQVKVYAFETRQIQAYTPQAIRAAIAADKAAS